MKNKLKFLTLILALGLIQATVLDIFKVFNIKPDLLLILVVIAALRYELKWVIIFSFAAGFFKDIFSVQSFGMNSALFVMWGYLITRVNREVSIDYDLIRLALMAVVAALNFILTQAILVYLGNYIPLGVFLRGIILQVIYTSLIFPLVYKLIKYE
ncbi:MAG: rod shape-determining protein MreD [Candidatus Omnitrophica bacterium]|nr:rod shape-determining protein MreD [Candidatus Omnitrophota bacterium]